MFQVESRSRALIFVSAATFFTLSVWFSTNAISGGLETEKAIDESAIAVLTIAVQLGFVFGTLLIAITNLSDLINARTLFAISAVLAAITNLLVIPIESTPALIAARFATGAFLGGVYPPAMKVISGWYTKGRGFALGTMVGALTIGSGSPHLLRSVFSENWQAVIVGSSILAITGGLILKFIVTDGPHDVNGAKFNPRYLIGALTERGPRLALTGYLGHQWELYAMWAWIGSFMLYVVGEKSLIGDSLDLASGLTFLVFAIGAVASSYAGAWSEKIGRTAVTSIAMIISGSVAAFIGFIPTEFTVLIVILAMIWGASIIADSAQFSTAMTELSDPAYRGTMLTFQTGIGFALTAVSIWLLPIVKDSSGWGWAFAMLALGPVVGTAAMLRLRSLPEASKLAAGKR
ncbi:MFS transporter [Candidatus Lucifugimonas marina]|uniref:MFS transporter n=1 Tax=Candidatus Lucifugimonas marina TaxID=3038979 RepID=A0AAJ5ZLA3_9CHLR|nr:MFS transporter [SAR202 cluster bacterium JH702]MDG0869366.1 MFS transporter [SAR202 cluster bacterium JH639]WFG36763.1 MFS transporter [SAR202 cluster bacterium JH545]WFG40697.1 MFS transporter [SAR202 cluster bacterium JH1073]